MWELRHLKKRKKLMRSLELVQDEAPHLPAGEGVNRVQKVTGGKEENESTIDSASQEMV